MIQGKTIGAIIIGRNEGARLIGCLDALPDGIDHVVYVDSGSTDGSAEAARNRGAHVVDLDLSKPFTAARARNAGFDWLRAQGPVEFVQFIDGDCQLRDGWIDTALTFLMEHPKAAAACGRRRERFPEASVYNRLCDTEWDTPIGRAKACGGDVLMRAEAFAEVAGFNPSLIAGEEPELCVRLRAKGWEIWRLDHEMTWHDAAMTRFGQWWKRTRRAGHAFAEGAAMHGAPPERHWVRETTRLMIWGAALPVLILAAALIITPWALMGFAIYPLQIARIARRSKGHPGAWSNATLTVLGKCAEALGALGYWWGRLGERQQEIIEYK